MSGAAVRAAGLVKVLGGRRHLDGVDLVLPPGEIAVVVGPNGAGKTLLLACLAGGLRPTAGRALVQGVPARGAGDRLSLLLQDALGLPALTPPEVARFYAALHPASTGTWSSLLDRLGLDDRGTPLAHCSGGMRRKVELAVALDPDVPVYLLDEPGAELDPGALDALHRLLVTRRDAGRTVVLTSHSPLDARLADRLVVLAGGRVVAEGAPGDLLDALPAVVRCRGAVHAARPALVEALRGGHVHGSGAERRGFLPDGGTTEDLEAALAGHDVAVAEDEPTFVDCFEFYASVAAEPPRGERATRSRGGD